jgi:hypothetical protein
MIAQNGTPPLSVFQNYFVTGDYIVGGWLKDAPDMAGFATGHISIPDGYQKAANDLNGVSSSVPVGADIVAAYLYWSTVESNQSTFAGQTAYFNGYPVKGVLRGNPNAPTSWSAGGCSGSNSGSKTMRTYRADVRPFLPVETDPTVPTYGATVANKTIGKIRFADSGSNGNTAPFTLGATLIVIYRVLNPGTPLNSIVIYDGSYAPSNSASTFIQTISGFYQATGGSPAKITHIVANGQLNKNEMVYLNNTSQPLLSLYGNSTPPFPGIYPNSAGINGSWDNPTWAIGKYVSANDAKESTMVVPTSTNGGCVSWGAIVLSTPVRDDDQDGLLNTWEDAQGYTDAVTNEWVPLPGANSGHKDIYLEVDWLDNLGANANKHTHLPQHDAIAALGGAFANQGINAHIDLGPNVYQDLPYVVHYPVTPPGPLPPGTIPTPAYAGGNAIPESALLCVDPNPNTAACAYPNQPAIGWKGGLDNIKNSQYLDANKTQPGGGFQTGRSKSYHYVLSGHSLGSPESYWSTVGTVLNDPKDNVRYPQLVSIVDSGNSATVTIKSPSGVIKPGDCPSAIIPACSDANADRVSITGALNQAALNGSYKFSVLSSIGPDADNFITTKLSIATSGVADGTYQFSPDPANKLFGEPELSLTYLGPTSRSGQSEFGGGGDSLITLGLWGADDPPAGCQPDPTQPLGGFAAYCANGVGTLAEQTGTLMHEVGHSIALTHGGTYFNDAQNPNLPTFELNCKPNYVSVMNYLFQVRGFPGAGVKYDYSSQNLATLNEASLNESAGIGISNYNTRWYAQPAAADKVSAALQNFARSHCDGSPLAVGEKAVRVDGPSQIGAIWLDWNNNLVQDPGTVAGDIDFNGIPNDAPFSGYDDVQGMNLQQMGARSSAFGQSGSGGIAFLGGGISFLGGGISFLGGGTDNDGGGISFLGGGISFLGGGISFLGGGIAFLGGGIDQNEDTANSTADPATGLNCTTLIPGSGVAPCTAYTTGTFQESGRKVPLVWSRPSFGQTRSYTVWRANGQYTTLNNANIAQFTAIASISSPNGPPAANYIDSNVKNNNFYTYFITDSNKLGAKSTASNVLVVWVHN